jgi:hypothetical protein
MAWTPPEWTAPKRGPVIKEYWYAHVQGDVVQVCVKFNWCQAATDSLRGSIKGFSKAARLRMIRTASRIDWDRLGSSLFVTLSYPDSCLNPHYKERTQKLYLFHRYIEKHLNKKVPMLWRTEWKPRRSGRLKGVVCPHTHCILGGVNYVDWRMIREWWRKINSHKGYIHTYVQRIINADGPIKYITKYMAKEDSLVRGAYLNSTFLHGRAWSIKRANLMPMHPVEFNRRLSPEEIRMAQAFAQSEFRTYNEFLNGGFTLLGNYNKKLFLAVLEDCT